MTKQNLAKILIPLCALISLLPVVPPAAALLGGVILALSFHNPYPTKDYTHRLLTWSVIGLGAGMNLVTVAQVGVQGIGYTIVSIVAVCVLGSLIGKLFGIEDEAKILITVGTAICGGSAIAAVTPVIRAKPHSVSVALGTVFILNALALLIFPAIGHHLAMSERSFGLWSALAIHDTSSVVGATVSYGKIAAEVGTTVKLARALWIVPIALLIGFVKKKDEAEIAAKTKFPWFILGFLLVSALVTWVPALQEPGQWVEAIARRLLVLTLFLIGLGLSRETLRKVGAKPFLFGFTLWVIVLVSTLAAIQSGLVD